MRFAKKSAELFIPDGSSEKEALSRVTHMGIGAHEDDIEIMAIDGILSCFRRSDQWFMGVVVTDGRTTPRGGEYKDFSDDEMRIVRMKEQKKAAVVGEYAALALLDYTREQYIDDMHKDALADLIALLKLSRPQVVYTHNLADKHDAHVAVALGALDAIRSLPKEERPENLYGCEVWRDLDWMSDTDKITFNCSRHEHLQTALIGVYDSQIEGGKRYDLASMGRRRVNATYFAPREVDVASGISYAMDLTPLIIDPSLDIQLYIHGYIERFENDVINRIKKYCRT